MIHYNASRSCRWAWQHHRGVRSQLMRSWCITSALQLWSSGKHVWHLKVNKELLKSSCFCPNLLALFNALQRFGLTKSDTACAVRVTAVPVPRKSRRTDLLAICSLSSSSREMANRHTKDCCFFISTSSPWVLALAVILKVWDSTSFPSAGLRGNASDSPKLKLPPASNFPQSVLLVRFFRCRFFSLASACLHDWVHIAHTESEVGSCKTMAEDLLVLGFGLWGIDSRKIMDWKL